MYSLNLVHCPFKYMTPVVQPHIYNISHADNLVILILTLFENVLYSNHNIYGNGMSIFISNVIVKAKYLLIFTKLLFLLLPRSIWHDDQVLYIWTNEIDYYIRNNSLTNRNLTFFYHPKYQDLMLRITNFEWPMRTKIMEVLISQPMKLSDLSTLLNFSKFSRKY